jgi:hypothetical protein
MPRQYEGDVVAEREEALADRGEQLRVVAAREVGAADRAREQHVADEGEARGRVHEHDVARRVAGQWCTCSVSSPTRTSSPSCSQRSGVKPSPSSKP